MDIRIIILHSILILHEHDILQGALKTELCSLWRTLNHFNTGIKNEERYFEVNLKWDSFHSDLSLPQSLLPDRMTDYHNCEKERCVPQSKSRSWKLQVEPK